MWTDEPLRDFHRHDMRMAERERERVMSHATCCICRKIIIPDTCYVLDNIFKKETSVCTACLSNQINLAHRFLKPEIAEFLDITLGETYQDTPEVA